MKKILLILSLLLNTSIFAQYSGLTVFPNNRSVLCSFENINDNRFGFHMGCFYQAGATSSPYIYRTPYMYFNRIGVNYGILNSGIVLMAGTKIDLISGPDPKIYPDATIKVQPIKLLAGNPDIWDISISYNISNKNYIGFGISIPYRYGSYYC